MQTSVIAIARSYPGVTFPALDMAVLKRKTKGPGQPPDSGYYLITPDFAEAVLNTINTGNRPFKPRSQSLIAPAMKAGNWKVTGETIAFGWDGNLRDGQNRLWACQMTKFPFVTLVAFNIDPETFDVMDTGAPRSGGDVFYIEGLSNHNIMAAATRWALLFEQNRVTGRGRFSNADLLAAFNDRFQGMQNSLPIANKVYRANKYPALSLLVALHFLFSKAVSPQKADEFFGGMVDPSLHATAYDPRKLLMDRLATLYAPGQRAHDVVVAATVVIAWNIFNRPRPGKGQKLWSRSDRLALEWSLKDPFPTL